MTRNAKSPVSSGDCTSGKDATCDVLAPVTPKEVSVDAREALRRLARALGRIAAREYLSSQSDQAIDSTTAPSASDDPTEDRT